MIRDVLSFIPFILMIFLVLSMDYKRMAQFITEQLRLFSIYYFVRACCEAMTILPGPAVHCRPGSTFNPPKEYEYSFFFLFVVGLILYRICLLMDYHSLHVVI